MYVGWALTVNTVHTLKLCRKADRVFDEGARGRTVWRKAGVRLFDLREH